MGLFKDLPDAADDASSPPRRRRWGRWLTLVLILLGIWVLLLFQSDWKSADRLLGGAVADAREVRAALAETDVERASAAAERAHARTQAALTRIDGPLWWLAERAPRIGRNVRAARDLAVLADASAGLAVEAVAQSGDLLTGEVDLFAEAGVVDLGVVEDLRDRAAAIDLEPVRSAAERVRAIDIAGLHPSLVSGRRGALDLADEVIGSAERASTTLAVLPGFLGADGPRSYFVGLQTPAELRGTGGLIGMFTALTIDGGALELQPAEHYGELVRAEDGEFLPGDERYAPVEASEEFAARYDHIDGRGFLASANTDPDLPTVGPVIAELVEDREGLTVDGVILIDPIGLQRLLAGHGPIDLPNELVAPGLPDPLPVDQLAQVLLVDHYDAFGAGAGGEGNQARRAYLTALVSVAFEQAITSEADLKPLLQSFGDAAGQRHLQVWSRDQDEQAAWESIGVAGKMTRVGEEGSTLSDLLAVTASNAGGDKKDVHVGHRMVARLSLSEVRGSGDVRSATRSGTIEVTAVNPLGTTGHDSYILGGMEPVTKFTVDRSAREDVAPLRTWFTLWAPDTSGVTAFRENGAQIGVGSGVIHGHRAFDHVLVVPPESEGTIAYDLTGPVTLFEEDGGLVYRVELWRQAKAIPDVWDLLITPPEGWQFVDAVLEGGGAGTGMGVLGDTGKPSLLRSPGEVRVTGGLTRDATLVVGLQIDGR